MEQDEDREDEKAMIEDAKKEKRNEKEDNSDIEKAIESMNVREIKKVFGRAMMDYRQQTNEVKKERKEMQTEMRLQWTENFGELRSFLEEKEIVN